MQKYFKEYKWSNISAMLRNLKSEPEICTEDFSDRLVVITGATSGIGFETAHKYASYGADIISINRNEQKSIELCEAITNQYGTKCTYWIADLSRLSEVHAVGEKLAALQTNIDVLIHNAGTFNTKKIVTPDNLEAVFQTNYLSTFILNYYLKDKFIKQNSGRILFVNSEAHRFAVWGLHLDNLAWERHAYSGSKSYGAAKLAQLLSMIKLNEYFVGTGVTVNAMHPGNVKTNSGQNNGPIYKFFKKIFIDRSAKTSDIAAEALYFLGVSRKLENISGKFFNLTTEEEPAPPALDKDAAEELWSLSLKLGGVK
ncbi:MAG: SDR family NAD(P)-dependent oxidoreductase [Chloroflexi bacterium]|nr:SDR family NAD(P)-dependent oxidoreductase [Chloroflexota bacterium]